MSPACRRRRSVTLLRLYATGGGKGRSITVSGSPRQPGFDHGDRHSNLAMRPAISGPSRRRREPVARARTPCRARATWARSARAVRLQAHIGRCDPLMSRHCGGPARQRTRPAHPNSCAASRWFRSRASTFQGEDILPIRPRHKARRGRPASQRWNAVVVKDMLLPKNRELCPHFLNGSTFLRRDGTFTNRGAA